MRPSGPTSSSIMSLPTSSTGKLIPHQGALYRVEDGDRRFVIEILVRLHNSHQSGSSLDGEPDASENTGGVSYRHELAFTRKDFEFAHRLFSILDTESRGLIGRDAIQEFVVLRCPVFWRRDDDLKRLADCNSSSPTFDEIWQSVAICSSNNSVRHDISAVSELGVEGWMVFCRFIALAQYLEAKRRFSARHLQQTMRQRNAPRGSELIMVDIPPLEPPAPLSPLQLAKYEQRSKAPLPLPELDLDHSLIAAHDATRRRPLGSSSASVRICLFGSSHSFPSGILPTGGGSKDNLEFALTYTRQHDQTLSRSSAVDEIVARRTMQDFKWLNATFDSHRVLGGTLCGRILPPFHPEGPSSSAIRVLSQFQKDADDSRFSVKSTSGAITAAATASVGKLRDAAKSFRSYLSSGASSVADEMVPPPTVAPVKKHVNKKSGSHRSLPDSYYDPNSPAGRARHMERYLNYLLEHPALSASFPLNTILRGSQSGLEAAKEMLAMCDRARNKLHNQMPHSDDGKISIASSVPNLTWIRTAAQAAMALQIHGMLETTGMTSASARLQHASLPALALVRNRDEDEGPVNDFSPTAESTDEGERISFEEGVVSVRSELHSDSSDDVAASCGDDYDLLPLPVPAPERRILNEGSAAGTASIPREPRFYYGGPSPRTGYDYEDDERNYVSAILSDMAVDENIDKLREVIGSVDNTLSRCLASCGAIGKAHKERQSLHLDVIRGIDLFPGMRGKFVSQRAFMKGVAGIEQSGCLYEEAFIAMIDDLSWQTSLSHSAVAAAEDVRSAVRASRVAANAKAAASSAVLTAQSACETGNFASIDEARAAQTRASMAQSHAMHAAVVEHEAKTVKRRATLALANDVKVWNIHRKREMLQSSIAYTRAQHEATRRAVDAWSSLRAGFVDSSPIAASHERTRNSASTERYERRKSGSTADMFEATATIYEAEATIIASEHPLLTPLHDFDSPAASEKANTQDDVEPDRQADSDDENSRLPFATASPILEEDKHNMVSASSSVGAVLKNSVHHPNYSSPSEGNGDEALSASMQSLVDGLMTWGGLEAEEEHFALPLGIAQSIVMEERMMDWDHNN